MDLAYLTVTDFDGILGTFLYIIGHPFIMLWFGMLIHFGKGEIDDAKSENRIPSWNFITRNKLKTSISIISALVGYSLLMPAPQDLGVVSDQVLNIMRIAGFTIGYSCDSIAGTIADEGKKRIPILNKGSQP